MKKTTLGTALLATAMFSAGCGMDPFAGVRPDTGPKLHEFGRPAIWHASFMPLGDTPFKASAGPGRYEDEDDKEWDYYVIDIERKRGKVWHLFYEGRLREGSYVFFQRDFRMDEIPSDLVRKKAKDIATYDEATRVVTFSIGTNQYTYRLPDR